MYIQFKNQTPGQKILAIILFGAVKLTRNIIKRKIIYNDQGVEFDGVDSWNFGVLFAQNNMIFGVDSIFSRHSKT